MKTIHLYGQLAEKYGKSFNLDVKTPAEAVKALHTQIPGFRQDIEAGNWHILRGDLAANDCDDEERLRMEMGDTRDIHIMPAISGAGNGSMNIIIGIILIVVGYLTFGTTSAVGMAMIAGGAGMVVGGIIQMTMKIPGADTDTSDSDDKSSFLFSGPKNTSTQGVAIPRGYGRVRCGSIVVSAGLYAEALPI